MKFFQSHEDQSNPFDFSSLGIDIYNESTFTKLSLYYHVGRYVSDDILKSLCYFGGQLSDFSFKAFEDYYVDYHDTKLLRKLRDCRVSSLRYESQQTFKTFEAIIACWSFTCLTESKKRYEMIRQKHDDIENVRHYKFKFNSKLC